MRHPGREPSRRARGVGTAPTATTLAVLAILAAACASGPAEVTGVTIEVPGGWDRVQTPPSPDVVATATWRGGRADASSLQVVVGCGSGALADLARAAVTEDRPPLRVTDAEVDTALEVAGADAAIGLEVTFGAGRPDDAQTVVVRGVYAEVADALVLVELSTPVRDADDDVIGTTLTSVSFDHAVLSDACGTG